MNHLHSNFLRWLIILSVILTILACNFLQEPAASPAPASEDPTEPFVTSESSAGQTETEKPDPLDHLLNLRSIQFSLTILYPDQTSRSIQVEVDSAGNLHLKLSTPQTEIVDAPENFDTPGLPAEVERYVIDGKIYQRNQDDGSWVTSTDTLDYQEELSEQLHGPDGPGLWLDILPDGSLQSTGQESVGGFTTNKYNVNGNVDGQTITGNLWFDMDSHALVQVELYVPAALTSLSEEPVQGEMKITLEVQKADIPRITVPK